MQTAPVAFFNVLIFFFSLIKLLMPATDPDGII